jgi:plasmid stabilization system protein ParE
MPNAKKPRGPRKFEVVFRATAEADLFGLYEYVMEQSGAEIARTYIDRIESACATLEAFPERGIRRDDIYRGLRILGFERRVAIAFKIDKRRHEVLVIRIFYGGRAYERVLLEPDAK